MDSLEDSADGMTKGMNPSSCRFFSSDSWVVLLPKSLKSQSNKGASLLLPSSHATDCAKDSKRLYANRSAAKVAVNLL